MSLYRCEACGCVENTALGFYWTRREECYPPQYRGKKLCSECGPPVMKAGNHLENTEFGTWHGRFPKESAAGWLVDSQGFLWPPDQDLSQLPKHLTIVGKVEEPTP